LDPATVSGIWCRHLPLPGAPQIVAVLAVLKQGLPVVVAPGEAEAMCAALNRRGHVDGVATSDVDALLFGAEVVYRTLKLQVPQ
jgi:5'-3' exonuclease